MDDDVQGRDSCLAEPRDNLSEWGKKEREIYSTRYTHLYMSVKVQRRFSLRFPSS